MLETGVRKGELRALRWKSLDLEAGVVRIEATIAEAVRADGSKYEGEIKARQAEASKVVRAGRPWEVTRKHFIGHHRTGGIAENAYQRMTAEGGLSFLKKERFGELRDTVDVKGRKVEIRIEREPAKYVSQDKEGNILRDQGGIALYMTDAEMAEQGLPKETVTVGAFDGDKPVGYSGDEFGATGTYVADDYQKGGLGVKMLDAYMNESGRLATGRH